jgi:uncharacterized membrane protein YhaH (DUF805 family)
MASVLSAEGFRFLFRTDQGRVGRQVWWLSVALLAGLVIALTLGWLALSPYAHRTLAERGKFFDTMTFVSYLYLAIYAFALLLISVCYVNLSAKRLRDGGWPAAFAGTVPLAALCTGALHWLQPRVAEVFPYAIVIGADIVLAAVVVWQMYLLGVANSADP